MTLEDAKSLYLLNLDPDVIKYTGDAAFESIEEASMFLKNYDHYEVYGMGRWAVILKENGAFCGWCGLKYTPAQDEYDIGFRLLKDYWNKGIATEAAKACIEYGFTKLNIKRIVGRAMADNQASVRVLEKIGLKYLTTYNFEGEAGVIYEILN